MVADGGGGGLLSTPRTGTLSYSMTVLVSRRGRRGSYVLLKHITAFPLLSRRSQFICFMHLKTRFCDVLNFLGGSLRLLLGGHVLFTRYLPGMACVLGENYILKRQQRNKYDTR